jgi:hypothetical protein
VSLIEQANEHLQAARFAEAVPLFLQHLADSPDDVPALVGLVRAYSRLQDWSAAEPLARRLTELEPADARHWYVLGVIQRKLGWLEEARSSQARGIALRPGDERIQLEIAKIERDLTARGAEPESEYAEGPIPPAESLPEQNEAEGWYVRLKNGETAGPVSLGELEEMLHAGLIRRREKCRLGGGRVQIVEEVLGTQRVRELLAPRPSDPGMADAPPSVRMGVVKCPACHQLVSAEAPLCVHCGQRLRPASSLAAQWMSWRRALSGVLERVPVRLAFGTAAVLLLVAFGVIAVSFGQGRERGPDITPTAQPSERTGGFAPSASGPPTVPPAVPPAPRRSRPAATPNTSPRSMQPAAPAGSPPGGNAPREGGRGTIRGTLTYYFNENYGNKPDTGSEVRILRGDWSSWPVAQMSIEQKVWTEGQSYAKTMADGNGNYSVEVPAGTWTVLIYSNHTNGPAGVEILYNIFQQTVQVADGAIVDVSHDFGMSYSR